MSATIAVEMWIRATARGNGMIVVRDIGELFQPASRRVVDYYCFNA
ncbi:MAG TPA: hypothetical protein VGQ41_14315 [Pyrinomonadaceae bacterium]|nr:hypothetical protein [Pyrinomonadaceae bacterium]